MTLAVLLLSALTAGAQITYHATDGTKGNSYTQDGVYIIENYKNLVDGDKATKWCVTQLGNPTFIEFYASEPITPKGYVLTTGNDTGKNPGRNPKSWTIKARAKESDDWTILTTVTDYTKMPAANTTECPFPLTNTNSYQYFRFEISEIQEGEIFQLAEFRFLPSNDPKDLATATVSGLNFANIYSETIDLSSLSLIDINGDTIDASKYDYVTKNYNDETLTNLTAIGDYKLVITPSSGSGYTGMLEYPFHVMLWINGGYCGNPDANDGKYVYYVITESEGGKTLYIRTNPDSPTNNDFSMENNLKFPNNNDNVVICDGVTSIGDEAFFGCGKLTSVTLPNSLTSIGNKAFMNCDGLTTLTIPNNVNSIGSQAFAGCGGLKTVVIGSGVTFIDNFAFWLCNNVTDVYCYADPTKLTWKRADDSFAPNKTTICHVIDEDEYKKRWATGDIHNDVNVTFKGDFGYLYDNANNSVMIGSILNTVQNVKLAGRTLYCDGNWQTLCLPFSLANLIGTPLEGFTVKELDTVAAYNGHVTGLDGETLYLNFKDATGIEAGKPYIVKKLDVTVASPVTPTITATEGTAGSTSQQGYVKLVDGSTEGYRWRTSISEENPSYCEFHTDQLVNVTGYTLTTGNQSANYDPTVWTLQAKLNKGDAWTTIDSRNVGENSGDALPIGRTVEKSYAVEHPDTYQYFRFEVSQTSGSFLCLTELTLQCKAAVPTNIVSPVFNGVTIDAAASTAVTSSDGTVTFCGSYSPVSVESGDKSKLLFGTDNTLYSPTDATQVGACRACLSVKSPVNLKLLTDVVLGRKAATPDANLNNDTQVDITDITTLIDNILNNRPPMPTVTTIVSNVDLGL